VEYYQKELESEEESNASKEILIRTLSNTTSPNQSRRAGRKKGNMAGGSGVNRMR